MATPGTPTRGAPRRKPPLPHAKPAADGFERLLIWAVFLLRFFPAANAHCALCALRFRWEVTARHHCSCPVCVKQNARGVWVLQRGGFPNPITVAAL
jgi:hypothetical protein